MLLYTAELKRSIREPLASKKEAVEEVLEKLALMVRGMMQHGYAFTCMLSANIGVSIYFNAAKQG